MSDQLLEFGIDCYRSLLHSLLLCILRIGTKATTSHRQLLPLSIPPLELESLNQALSPDMLNAGAEKIRFHRTAVRPGQYTPLGMDEYLFGVLHNRTKIEK
jgi:hypothetical protein